MLQGVISGLVSETTSVNLFYHCPLKEEYTEAIYFYLPFTFRHFMPKFLYVVNIILTCDYINTLHLIFKEYISVTQ